MLSPYLRADGGDVPVTPYLRADGGDVPVTLNIAGHAAPAPVGTPIDTLLTNRPFYVAHRLGGTEYPEHTMQGMTASIQAGFTAFEFSTYQTRDGVFIGSHDWTTERTTGQRHEIWNTDWSTIQTLNQPAGPIIRLEDAVAAMPEDSVLVLDHKSTSATSAYNEGDRRSEDALFDLLPTLFDNPTERVIWKLFADSDSDQRAAQLGYKTMVMLYPGEVAGADLNRWDILGMEHNATQEIWNTLLATGKPTLAHIIVNYAQATTGLGRGAHGLMSSVPSVVAPIT
jgi:glycerophosphoryl diester phosphodiesterase